jgi:WD40 repeat protein
MRIYLPIWGIILIVIAVSSPTFGQSPSESYRYVQPSWANAGNRLSIVENNSVFIRDPYTGQIIKPLGNCPNGWLQDAWSPDDNLLAVVCNYNEIHIWETSTGNLIQVLQSDVVPLGAIEWSPNQSRLFATAIDSPGLLVWNTESWEMIPVDVYAAGIYIAFSSAGEKFLTGNSGGFAIWNGNDFSLANLIRIDPSHYYISKVIWAPNGQTITTSSVHGVVRIWDANTGSMLSEFTANPHATINQPLPSFFVSSRIYDIAYSADGRYILTISEDGTVQSWDTVRGAVQSQVMLPSVGTARFSPFGGQLAYMRLGLLASDVASASANGGSLLQLTVPFTSREMVDALTSGCGVTFNDQTRTDLSTLTAQVEALPDIAIPPGCRADLLAVAQALQAQ